MGNLGKTGPVWWCQPPLVKASSLREGFRPWHVLRDFPIHLGKSQSVARGREGVESGSEGSASAQYPPLGTFRIQSDPYRCTLHLGK